MFKYLEGRTSKALFSIYSGRIFLRSATGLLSLFVPIFLYELFDFNFQYVIIFFLVSHLIYSLSVAFGCRYLNKIGLRRSLQISIVWLVLYYLIFYLINFLQISEKENIFLFLIAALLFVTLYRIMYWLPLHTDLAKFTNKRNRAKQLSLFESLGTIALAVMPIIAGWILLKYNYDVLFFVSILVILCSFIPFSKLPKTRERFCWSYTQTWKEFFSKKRRKVVLAFLGDGAESAIGDVVWPIFIWELLQGNYFEVGALSSLVVAVTVFLQLIFGKYADKWDKSKMIRTGSLMYALGWIAKIFIVTGFQIFIVSTYHNFSKIFARTPFDALNYEKAADEGHYVDEYTVLHEVSINMGISMMFAFVLILSFFFSVEWSFILAALASLTMNFLGSDYNTGERINQALEKKQYSN